MIPPPGFADLGESERHDLRIYLLMLLDHAREMLDERLARAEGSDLAREQAYQLLIMSWNATQVALSIHASLVAEAAGPHELAGFIAEHLPAEV